ncbi:MAG TPA: histidine kinase, partial [Candidatus Dormibacteraeota bacterium]|nr:histidine kinase [Candidatus Dormibacteraeota bacterium]
AASLAAINFVRSSFASRLARGEPMDELLVQVADALLDSMHLDAAEVWLHEKGTLQLAARAPRDGPAEFAITAEEESISANAGISGPAWVKTWLPSLLEGRPSASVRIAPMSDSGHLLGLIVVERGLHPDRLARDADVILEELAREVGAGVHKQRLDASLQASLEQLRRHATELQASRSRIVVAADAERRRIERDLHDGAQQYLVAIAVKARLIQQLARTDASRSKALIEELTSDVEGALDELRTLAHGIYPPLLSSDGLGTALASAGRRASIPVHVETDGLARYQPEIEAAVYYCCLEALQNAAKYAGGGAAARVRVWEEDGSLQFIVSDDGSGFDLEQKGLGVGLTNMTDRVGAVGGSLGVESAPSSGTRVRGAIPLTQT